MIVERYTSTNADEWNAFVRTSRNGTFLIERAYMDYHSDRFDDHSLMIRDNKGELLAILPAHAKLDVISSHSGLSHGGLFVGSSLKTSEYLVAFEQLLLYFQDEGFRFLDYKAIPHIYHRQPSDDDRYALFLLNAPLVRRDLLSVVDRERVLPYQSRRIRGIKKAQSADVALKADVQLSSFWKLLTETLSSRHGAEPVHTLEEIQLLHSRFPANIQLHGAYSSDEKLLAGVVLYISEFVAHAQYIAASTKGREVCALDLLFDKLIRDESLDARYLDFGSSHENDGRALNQGLLDFKEGFGARSVACERYRIDLSSIRPGILTEALQ